MGVEMGHSLRSQPMFPLRTVVFGALIPTLIFQIGIGAILPVLVPTAVGLGSSLAAAGMVAALLPVGQLLADLPAGALAARVGDRMAMVIAGVVAAAAALGAALAPGLLTLAAAVVGVGAASAVFNLARHSYLTVVAAPDHRARVMSTLAGAHRIGQFLGPFLGAFVIAAGEVRYAYVLAAVAAGAAVLVLVLAPSLGAAQQRSPRYSLRCVAGRRKSGAGGNSPTLRQLLREHRNVFTSLGVAVLLVGAVRGARQAVIPLWGAYLGLDPATISLIFGLSGGLDMLLFYPAGKIMDHYGRLWVGIPAMLTMGGAMVALPFTADILGLSVAAAVMGLGNGLSSGILMILGSDVSPSAGRARFLGIWRVLQDGGAALGPLVVAAGAALGSLALGVGIAGILGIGAAGALVRWVPRWSVYANRTTQRRAGLRP